MTARNKYKPRAGGLKMRYALIIFFFALAALAGPMDIYVDCEAENKLDLVFVIDSSGSMGSIIASIRDITARLDSILSECDVHWGIVTFVDSVRGDHDFDTTTPGIDLTDDYYSFRDDLPWGLTSGDTPNECLDALWVTAHCINWRPDALHIAFLFTGSVFCEIGDHCAQCHGNLTKEECLDTLMNHDIILYPIVRYPLAWATCVPPPPYHMDFWRLVADTTGGRFWNLLSFWQDSLLYWADSMNSLVSESVYVANNLSSTVSAEIRLESICGVELFDTLIDIGTIAAGDSASAGFRFAIDDTVAKPAFHVIGDFNSGAYSETLLVTLDTCGCHEAIIELVPGWNLVSVPSDQVVPLSYFESALGDAYLYSPVLGIYGDASVLAPGFGYWILSGENSRVMFGGVPIDGEDIPTFTGWNALGGGSLPFLPPEGLTGGSALWPMFEYNGIDYDPADVIEVGKGYWLLGTSPGNWEAP